jgi:hypothetical protein
MSILVQALLPFAAFLIFGTQRDTFIAWGFVRPDKDVNSTFDESQEPIEPPEKSLDLPSIAV